MRSDPFQLPLSNVADAHVLVAAVQLSAERAGVVLRAPPPVPTTCCGRGCNGCVWEGYFTALRYWRDQAADLCGRDHVPPGGESLEARVR